MCVLYATCRISIYLLCMVHSSQLCENALPGVSDRRWHPVRARDHGPYQENVLREQGFVVAAVAVAVVAAAAAVDVTAVAEEHRYVAGGPSQAATLAFWMWE